MKSYGCLTFCAAILFAVSTSAFAGVFDGNLFANRADASNDDSFFPGQALTLGEVNETPAYVASEIEGQYGECAGCAAAAADAEFAPVVAYDAFPYEPFYAEPFYSDFYFADPYFAYERPFKPVRSTLGAIKRPFSRIFRGVKELLCNKSYNYCQPAYVCDPCWSVCDPCWSPCAFDVCAPCAEPVVEPCAPCGVPLASGPCYPCAPIFGSPAVYAPASCCGYGYAPGETNELDPETGKARDAAASSKNAPKRLSTVEQDATDSAVEPAVPAASQQDGYDDPNAIPSDAEPINAPAAQPRVGAGIIKMLVPEDAIVYVNGYRTKQKGALRTFAAKNLEYGETYAFEIRVVENRDGRFYEDVQTTILAPGDSAALAFNPVPRDEAYALNK